MYEWPMDMDMDNGVGMDCGSGEMGRTEEDKGEKIGTTVIE